MAHCDPFRDQLLDSLYGLLEEREQEELSAHLAICPDCRAALVLAQAQQGLLARAARAVECVPEFTSPAEENHSPAPQPASAPVAPTVPESPAPLPVPGVPRPRFRFRAPRLAWSAAAAALLIAVAGYALYDRGRTSRTATLASLRQEIEQIEARQAKVATESETRRSQLMKEARSGALQLHVMGSPRLHQTASSLLLITTRDADGAPAPATLSVALLHPANGTALFRTDVTSRGQARIELPAIPAAQGEAARLIVEARSGAVNARVEERLAVAPSDHITQLLTDRIVYRPGEALYYRAVALERVSLTPPTRSLALRAELLDADGRVVAHAEGATEAGGVLAGKFALASRLASGNYVLRVRGAAGVRSSEALQPLEIFRDDQPELALQKQRYRVGDTVNLDIYSATVNPKLRAEVRVNGQRVQSNISMPSNNTPGMGLQGGFGFGGGVGFGGGFGGPLPRSGGAPGSVGGIMGGMGSPGVVLPSKEVNFAPPAQLQFPLPRSLPGNQAVAEILLEDGKQRNLVRQPIPLEPRQLDVDFFPEGGELIAGVPNRVYYRVRAEDGDFAEPEGHVIVLSRTGVLFDSERHQGVGSFVFTPDPNAGYSVRLTSAAGTREITEPFAKLGIRTEGLVLHVPQPVGVEGEPVEAVLRLRGAPRRVLLLAECRGRLVDEQWVEVNGAETKVQLRPLTGTRGVVRVTAYQTAAEGLRPLAERLIFRAPAQSLQLAVEGAEPHTGQSVNWTVRARDARGAAARAYVLATVVDERFRPTQERPPAEHFFLATSVRGGADLDSAHLLLGESAEAKRALDLFLGTHGWRRFRHIETDRTLAYLQGLIPDAKIAAVPSFFSRESASLDALRQKAAARYEAALDPMNRETAHELRDLDERRAVLLTTARQAREELESYETRPTRLIPAVLLVVLLALVVAGLGLLGTGAVRVLCGRVATGPFAGAFACLLVCVGLAALLLRLNPPSESVGVDQFARKQSRHGQEAVERRSGVSLRFDNKGVPLPPAGSFGAVSRPDEVRESRGSSVIKSKDASGQQGKKRLGSSANDNDAVKELARSRGRAQWRQRDELAARAYYHRFTNPYMFGGGGVSSEPKRGDPTEPKSLPGGGTAPTPPSLPAIDNPATTPGLPPPGPGGRPQFPRESTAKGSEKKVVEQNKHDALQQNSKSRLEREYAYDLVRGLRAETLLWHANLLVEGVSAPLRLTAPVVPGTYRVLLLGHDDAGRFGFHQRQLEVTPSDGKTRR